MAAEFASDTFDNEGINSDVSVYAQFVALPEIGDYEINGNNFVWTWNADSNVNYYEVRFDSESARVSRATIAAGVATYSLNTTQIRAYAGRSQTYYYRCGGKRKKDGAWRV